MSNSPPTISDATGVHVAFLVANGAVVSTANPLPISGSAGGGGSSTLPTGAATSALQPAIHADGGSLAHIQNFPANQTVTISGTVPVSAAALPLPAGAATAAKQPAIGVAGTPSADVLSMQGVVNGTALTVSGNAGGFSVVAGGNFNRPANTTAYASGQLVANSTTAGSVVPVTCPVARTNGGTGQILRARLTKTGTSLTNASFRIHLYRVAPVCTNGDGGAWLTDNATNYIGSLDVTMNRAFTDGAKGIAVSNDAGQLLFLAAVGSVNVYALVEARAAYTPVSGETFTVALEALQD